MSQLLVLNDAGNYVPATPDQIIDAARLAIGGKMARYSAAFENPRDVADFLKIKLGGLENEVFAVMFLDLQNKLIAYKEMFSGTINQAAIYPREIAKEALKLNASNVILAHNHPSGNIHPSSADEQMTKKIKDVLAGLDVQVLDHIVIGGNNYTSFALDGIL